MKTLSRYFRVMLSVILLAVILTGCQSNPEDEVRKVAQTYFDAVKIGDVEKAISCATPAIQKEMEQALKLSGFISEAVFGQNANDLITSFLGISAAGEYDNYEFKATDVKFTDDEHATVTVEVYIDGSLDQETKLYTVKYQDEWYIEK